MRWDVPELYCRNAPDYLLRNRDLCNSITSGGDLVFTESISEYSKDMAKNTHLEHLEDDILNQGKQGGFNSIAFLRELGDMLTRPQSNVRVTTKWDGAPAIICGTDPVSKQFFVGTKSVFAKTAPKIIYSEV